MRISLKALMGLLNLNLGQGLKSPSPETLQLGETPLTAEQLTTIHAGYKAPTVNPITEHLNDESLTLEKQILRDLKSLTRDGTLSTEFRRAGPVIILPPEIDINKFISSLKVEQPELAEVQSLADIKSTKSKLKVLILNRNDLNGNLDNQAGAFRHYASNDRENFITLVQDKEHVKGLWKAGEMAVGIAGFRLIDASSGSSKLIEEGNEYKYLVSPKT